jgi:hypothetical protein
VRRPRDEAHHPRDRERRPREAARRFLEAGTLIISRLRSFLAMVVRASRLRCPANQG